MDSKGTLLCLKKFETNLLWNRIWFPAVKDFLSSTLSLIKAILFPIEEDESVTKMKERFRRKMRKRKHKGIKYAGRSTLKNVYKNHCEMFGGLFFLGKKRAIGGTIVVGDKIVTSTPDFAYPLASIPQDGYTLESCRLLFIVEVKGTPINNASSECLEEQLDSYVLGQVGSELFAQAKTSAMYPNSLGMICMETKLIFVYLKMPKTHCNVSFPLRTEGKIHYTRPFDMLKAIDRAEVCEFLYWLGCIQNRYGRKLLV